MNAGTPLASIFGASGKCHSVEHQTMQLIILYRCVFAEMYKRKPILQGTSDLDQMHKIFALCGPPTPKTMPGFDRLPNFDQVKKNVRPGRTLESQHSE